MQFVIIMVLMLGVMYVLMIRPQRQRQAQQQSMINDAGVGDDVLTTGGIYGTISEVEGDDIVVEIASGDHGAHDPARYCRRSSPGGRRGRGRRGRRGRRRRRRDQDVETSDEPDEAVVTDGEEGVRAVAGEASPGDDRR